MTMTTTETLRATLTKFSRRALAPVALLCLTLAAPLSVSADGGPAIGVVSHKNLLKQSTAFTKFEERVRELESTFRASVTKHLEEIDAAANKILEQKETLSSADFDKKVTSLTKRQKEVTARHQDTSKKIEAALKPALEKIKKAVDAAIAKVAKTKKLDIVLHESSTAHVVPALDITNDVAKELNVSLKEVKVSFPKISS